MKKLLQCLPLLFLSLMVNAQQTEDDVPIAKSKTYGNYKPIDFKTSKQLKGTVVLSGIVVKVDWCEDDCLTVWVKKNDGSTVLVGTKDYGFSVPKKIIGKRITIQGIEPDKYKTDKQTGNKEYQKGIQIVATGIRIFE